MGGLRNYIIRRVISSIPTLIGISILTFTIIHLAPGGPLKFSLALRGDISPEYLLEMEKRLGLDKPIWEQYLIWLKNIITGDLGTSYIKEVPIIDLLQIYAGNTLKLMFSAQILAVLIAVPLGIISAVKQDTLIDNTARFASLFGVSMPSFWTGLMLMFLFSVKLDLLPVFGARTIGAVYDYSMAAILDEFMHMILPVTVLGLSSAALITRLVRSSMLEVLNQDYITTARAKGLKENIVVYKHALRNALLPVVTVVGMSMGFLLAGATVTETVFAWPGMGRFVVQSTFNRDYPAIMAVTMMVALMVVVTNLITDLTYGFLDPRIRFE
ncbi:MAG: ABC transporter permease [Candidatus Bathyarchaeota archaeon]|nr:ABC transporter permease [Candidatus Bathyarchaeota archaeon]